MAHHICIQDDCTTFDGEMIPFGKRAIEKEITRAVNEILDTVVHKIGKDPVLICGTGDARIMLGRKLEDRLKRKVFYE